MRPNPRVVDLSHYQTVNDWGAVMRAGIVGVIHKATEGTGYVDKMYAARKSAARQAGLLWGAYHFLRPGSIPAQVVHFLDIAEIDDALLLALDHEDPAVSLGDMKQFLKLVRQQTGRDAILYSGFLIKQQLKGNDADLAKIRLWLSHYSNSPTWPKAWKKPWLWQFTGDGKGPAPHSIAGIAGTGIDINSFDGTAAQLAAEWSGKAVLAPEKPVQPVQAPQGTIPAPVAPLPPVKPVEAPTLTQKPPVVVPAQANTPAVPASAGGVAAGGTAVVVAAQAGLPWWQVVLIGIAVLAVVGAGIWVAMFRKGK